MPVPLLIPDRTGLEQAAELLRGGAVIGFPTDTVYGLAALARDERALLRVYAVKGRSPSQPLILMPPSTQSLSGWAAIDGRAQAVMRRWWPGPLTLILPAESGIPPPLSSGTPPAIGVRIPDHPVARALLDVVGEPLATTSANRSGLPPALTALAAAGLDGLGAVLDGGSAPGGVPSTLLDLSRARPRLLRTGPLTATDLGLAQRA